jgi:hypothetical protein
MLVTSVATCEELARHTTSIFKSPSSKHAFQKQRFRRRILFQPRFIAIIQSPESWDDAVVVHRSAIPPTYTHTTTAPQHTSGDANKYIRDVKKTYIIFAPPAINSRNASGNAKSQQINNPTFPIGVSKTSCTSRPEEVRCSRSGPLLSCLA